MTVAPTTSPITVVTDGSQPKIAMSIDFADRLMTNLAATGLDPTLLDPLYAAVSTATDLTADSADSGCLDLWPDADPMPLSEPAVLGSVTGDLLAVLIPGTPATLDAITVAVRVATEAGANLDTTDPRLIAEVHTARWVVLNRCESDLHDFHPELAPHGPRTPGAVLVTLVELSAA